MDNKIIKRLKGKFLHRFEIKDGMPFLTMINLHIEDYNTIKNELILKYNKLIKKESNVDYFYIDPNKGIEFNIDTKRKVFKIKVNKELVIDQPILFEDNLSELIEYIKINNGLYIDVAYINKNRQEEFIINLLNVVVDNEDINKEFINIDDKFLSIPDTQWYNDGNILPGGLALGFVEQDDKRNALLLFKYISEMSYNLFKDLYENHFEITETSFLTNMNIIIDEKSKDNILVKVEMLDVEKKNILFETTTPIKTTHNYFEFKKEFKKNGYALVGFTKERDNDQFDIICKLGNIIILDEKRKTNYISWVDPIELDFGGIEGRKKVLINSNDLTVGIYKYFKLRELTSRKLRKIFNEVVVYSIGKSLDLPIAKVIFHFESNTIGIISELVTPPVYTFKDLENINIIEKKSLIEMIAFDIFIYNTDRHAENICFTKVNQVYTPKLIDHSSSLGGFEKDSIKKLTSNPVMMVPYNLIGLGKIVNEVNSFNVFTNIIRKIKLLNIEKVVKKAIDQKELLIHIKANNVYDDNFEKEIIKGLEYRKKNIENIIKKSLDL